MRVGLALVLVLVAAVCAQPPGYVPQTWDTDNTIFKFTRMIPLKSFNADPADLAALGREGGPMDEGDIFDFLNEEADQDDIAQRLSPGDSTTREAGYTWLGQMADHDMTLDFSSKLDKRNNVHALVNGQTPYLDLSNLYGHRWAMEPSMMDPNDPIKFLIGHGPFEGNPGDIGCPIDFQRNADRSAVLLEGRDDENLGVALVHLVWAAFHNAAVDVIRENNPNLSDNDVFVQARQYTRFHWQWIMRFDHLPEIVNPTLVDNVAARGNKIVKCQVDKPFAMPVEFSAAAYRLGHSIVRPRYTFNEVFHPVTFPNFADLEDSRTTLRGGRVIIIPWMIGWNNFFENPDAGTLDETGNFISTAQMGRKIDTIISHGLMAHLAPGFSLASRNLQRGWALGLPSGQSVARFLRSRGCGVPIFTNDQLGLTQDIWKYKEAPLWWYCLAEADIMTNGNFLDGSCGTIVAEVFLGLLKCDPLSWMNLEPNWTPETSPLKLADGRAIEDMLDVVEFAGMFKEFRIDDLSAMIEAQLAKNAEASGISTQK